MRPLILLLIPLVFMFPRPVNAGRMSSPILQVNASSRVNIEAPVFNQAVQGSVVIRGNAFAGGFQSFEVDFSYSDDPTRTWFLIQESTTPIQNGILAVWDTTIITDGEYSLRLLISLMDGSQEEVVVENLRVRNYTPIETETPAPTSPYPTPVPGISVASATPQVTATTTMTSHPATQTVLTAHPAEISASQRS